MPPFHSVEGSVINAVQWLKLGVESTGAVVITIGTLLGVYRFLVALARREAADFTAIRLVVARYLALALEFQLGADILSTAVAPEWQQIGKLGAVAVIRTALNYFLSKEMREEQKSSRDEARVAANAARPAGEVARES
jgi:uncharacterized membrane protein